MDSALVIKVKYGDTLRRFHAHVYENNQLDLDMVRLRAKIISLFNFPADANFILRYVDEDGDLVTLLDDDDLHDVMRQCLKFLRIDVYMSYECGGNSNPRFSGSATPLRSPTSPNQFLSGNVAIADALKPVPAPLVEALSNLYLDLVSKATSSSPVVAAVADCISKLGQSVLNSDCQPQVASGPSSKNGVPQEPVTDNGVASQFTNVDSYSNASPQVEAVNVTKAVVAGVVPVDLNTLPCEAYPSQLRNVNAALFPSAVPDGGGEKGKASTGDGFTGEGSSSGTFTSNAAPGSSSNQATAMGSLSSPVVDCLFSGTYIADSEAPSFGNHCLNPFKRSHNYTEATDGMFHKGVQCDGCGVYPITGPRFKSKVKENYDLCRICCYEMGNGTDYVRIDCPVPVHSPQFFNGVYEHPPWVGPSTLPHLSRRGAIMKHTRRKMDSRFILDVSVIDGTIMAPSTAFTKIWRMQNNGTSVWPKGTKLVWIGGDELNFSMSIDLEIPEDGFPVDKELDIAVNFRAPQLPGRYISYWRMAYPAVKQFGQRVWVLIQVGTHLKESFYEGSQRLNLNIPLDPSGSKGNQMIDMNFQHIMDDVFLQPQNSTSPTEPVKKKVDEQPMLEPENNIPINESAFDGHTSHTSLPTTSVAPSPVSYPVIDFSETAPAVSSNEQSSAVDALSLSPGIGGNNSVEETLLKELEEMGFKLVELNKEILRKNEYNMEQSVDDLCGAYEWDHIIEELQEMGFHDNEMNKRLLMKNNGSIKRVVMDLINGE